MSRGLFLPRLALPALFAPQPAAQQAGRPPNVVDIMADELAYFELGHIGHPYIRTPRTEAMAAERLRFTRVHRSAHRCAAT